MVQGYQYQQCGQNVFHGFDNLCMEQDKHSDALVLHQGYDLCKPSCEDRLQESHQRVLHAWKEPFNSQQ